MIYLNVDFYIKLTSKMIHVSQIILWETQWCHQLVPH